MLIIPDLNFILRSKFINHVTLTALTVVTFADSNLNISFLYCSLVFF